MSKHLSDFKLTIRKSHEIFGYESSQKRREASRRNLATARDRLREIYDAGKKAVSGN